MARDYKGFVKNNIYHVYNRGNNKAPIFNDDQDYHNLLKRLKILLSLEVHKVTRAQGKDHLRLTPFPKGSFDILAFCLMPNHFHFVIRQNSNIKVGHLIKKLFTSYAKYFNKKYGRVGRLFQDIFKSKSVNNDEYLCQVTAYVHNNPEDINYNYSSLSSYMNPNSDSLCNTEVVMSLFNNDINLYIKFAKDSKLLSKKIIEKW